MASTYTPDQLGIKAPTGGWQTGAWVEGRQVWQDPSGQWTLSDAGVINPYSNQSGAGQAVSQEVRGQSAAQQGVSLDKFNQFITNQNQKAASVVPQANVVTNAGSVMPGAGNVGGGAAIGATTQQTPDLTALYQNLYKDLGIEEKEAQIVEAEKKMLEARNQISDNPFLSVSLMDNRLRRLRQGYETETAPLRNEVAMKKADVETQLNLQMKQFDINSQAAQQALNQFNMLLESGALNNASGEDVANLTRMTGMSSGMIQAAIDSSKQQGLTVSTYDDGQNEYFISVDRAGNIVNRQLVGPSKSVATANQGFSTQDFMNSIAEQQFRQSELQSILEEVQLPQFTPAGGMGSTYTDPNTGVSYQYTRTGWQRV